MALAASRLTTVLGKNSDALQDYAKSLAKVSVYKPEDIVASEAVLARYARSEKAIKALTPATLNLAAATGMDLNDAAKKIGVTIDTSTNMLKKYGVEVHGAAGSVERYNSVLKGLKEVYGGASEAQLEALGPLSQLQKMADEVSESFASGLMPALQEFAGELLGQQGKIEDLAKVIGEKLGEALKDIYKWIQEHKEQIKKGVEIFIDAAPWLAGAGAITTVATAVGTLVGAVEKLGAVKLAGWALKLLGGGAVGAGAGVAGVAAIPLAGAGLAYAANKELSEMTSTEAYNKQVEETGVYSETGQVNVRGTKAQMGPPIPTKAQMDANAAATDARLKAKNPGADDLGLKDLSEKKDTERKKELAASKKAGEELEKFQTEDARIRWLKVGGIDQEGYDKARRDAMEAARYEERDLNKALQLQGDLKIRAAKKNGSARMLILEKEYKSELTLLKSNGLSTVELERQYAEERKKIARDESLEKSKFITDYANVTLDMLSKTLEGHKGTAIARKRIAQGEALISGAQGIMGVLSNTDAYMKYLGVVAGPIAMGVEMGLIGAMTLSQLGTIERSKFAYGGRVTGGTPGQDSVPAMLMPGEIVYNPALPDPRLASMINNQSSNTVHIGGTQVIVQGTVSRRQINDIGVVTERALINAMRKAQVMGKISANGMKIRN